MRITGWQAQALCARPGTDPELFFPDDTAPTYPARVAAAKRVCAACPVRSACLADVLRREQPGRRWGVIAATTAEERAQLAPGPATVERRAALAPSPTRATAARSAGTRCSSGPSARTRDGAAAPITSPKPCCSR